MVKLHVNVDHVATLRQARGGADPDPIAAATMAELAGADGITVHLREDRRHIQERDLRILKQTVRGVLNLEMALSEEILPIALEIRPQEVCLVPERRQELTTEGGLDAVKEVSRLREFIPRFKEKGIAVSLFLNAKSEQLETAASVGADFVEIHTGVYSHAKGSDVAKEITRIRESVQLGKRLGLRMNAGHGLNYQNVAAIAAIAGIEELNIGHAIVSRAVFVGFQNAVAEMKRLIDQAVFSKGNL